MIAMALSSRPELLIADEPTTALDVTIQAQILDAAARPSAAVWDEHPADHARPGRCGEMCDRVAVMYAGRIVEQAPVDALFDDPEHPYSLGLMNAIPRPDLARRRAEADRRFAAGHGPPPSGCRFHPRCPYRRADLR